MIWINKKDFEDTYAVLKKEKQLNPIFVELKQFIEDEFGIQVFNIIFEPIKKDFVNKINKNSYLYGNKYKLICYVGSYAEREKMQNKISVIQTGFPNAYKMVNDEIKQKMILDKLFELNQIYNHKIKAMKEEIWVDYFYWFSTDYMNYIVSKLEKKLIDNILNEYEKKANIWKIYTNGFSFFIFYQTDKDLNLNQENGITEEIKNTIFLSLKELDEFNFYKVDYIHFDSKETIDHKYKGSLYSYFK